MGFDAFAARAAAAGVDGVLALDIPVEEAGPIRHALLEHGLDPIYLLSPTTTPERARRAGELGRGFLYLISRLGRDRRAGEPVGRAPGDGGPGAGGDAGCRLPSASGSRGPSTSARSPTLPMRPSSAAPSSR